MRTQIVVTGASGFIGNALCCYLSTLNNMHVVGIGRTTSSKSLGKLYNCLDMLDAHRLRKFLVIQKPSIIFHSAGSRAIGSSEMVSANVLTTTVLFETIRNIPQYHPRVIIIGSAAEYGDRLPSTRGILEDSMLQPVSLYGWVKLLQTQSALHYARCGEDVVVARLFNIFGPGIPDTLAAGKFAREIINFKKRPSSGAFSVSDLRGVRDFLDIRDVCEALNQLSLFGKSGEVYNICSGKGIQMGDVLSRMIAHADNFKIKFKVDKTRKPGVLYSVGSCAKFKKISHWLPKIDMKTSIADTLSYYSSSFSDCS